MIRTTNMLEILPCLTLDNLSLFCNKLVMLLLGKSTQDCPIHILFHGLENGQPMVEYVSLKPLFEFFKVKDLFKKHWILALKWMMEEHIH
jgi:hypothetical protein